MDIIVVTGYLTRWTERHTSLSIDCRLGSIVTESSALLTVEITDVGQPLSR